MERRACPALFVSAPASNQGKTTITAALARFHSTQGRRVRVFKTGPDFLDPMILERASGRPAYQLDLWMGGEEHCRTLLYDAASHADLILIEGVMGLFDGTPSSADLAQLLGVPVLAVIDAESMAQSFGAIAHGLASYRAGLPFYGALANRVAGARHAELLQQGMRAESTYLGAVMRDPGVELPDRHLGLVQAEEVGDLEQRLNAAAATLKGTGLTELPPAVEFAAPETPCKASHSHHNAHHLRRGSHSPAYASVSRATVLSPFSTRPTWIYCVRWGLSWSFFRRSLTAICRRWTVFTCLEAIRSCIYPS